MMTDATNVLLLCMIPALVILLLAYTVNRSASKRATQAMAEIHRDEAWMGRFVRDHKPRVTVHSLTNKLFGTKKPRETLEHIFGIVEEFADVSFYQGVIDWLKMRTKARKVIIRAGQNVWVDIKFLINYAAAKLLGFQRGIYWFYDGRADPGRQAALLASLIRFDRPELGVWIDWEHNYGGAHEGLKNVVAMMQEVERLLPGIEIGMYTGFYFFVENSNPIANAAQYAYLKTKKLWLAFYALLANVRIPSLWPVMKYWQKGTPAVGKAWGAETEEIDMNEDMSGDPAPQPDPPKEETMEYKFTVLTNERTSANATIANLTGKQYQVGDIVNVLEIVPVGADKWFKLGASLYAAFVYNGTTRAELVTPPPVLDAVKFVIESTEHHYVIRDNATGKRYGATVTDAPNVEFVELL